MNEMKSKKLTETLLELGFRPNLLGFEYIKEAVMEVVDSGVSRITLTTQLYPTIAEKHATTKGNVERGIRHAILVASNKPDFSKRWYRVFKANIVAPNEAMSNGECIWLLAQVVGGKV